VERPAAAPQTLRRLRIFSDVFARAAVDSSNHRVLLHALRAVHALRGRDLGCQHTLPSRRGPELFQAFLANAAYSLGSVIFEVPTGVIADTLGRRVSFLLSVAVLATATLLYVGIAHVGGGVAACAAASVLVALGFTFYSGAMEAWLVDALAATGYRGCSIRRSREVSR
jgi:MFS family permease